MSESPDSVRVNSHANRKLVSGRDGPQNSMTGDLKITINQRYPLREAAQAHRDLESRKTTGSTVLLP